MSELFQVDNDGNLQKMAGIDMGWLPLDITMLPLWMSTEDLTWGEYTNSPTYNFGTNGFLEYSVVDFNIIRTGHWVNTVTGFRLMAKMWLDDGADVGHLALFDDNDVMVSESELTTGSTNLENVTATEVFMLQDLDAQYQEPYRLKIKVDGGNDFLNLHHAWLVVVEMVVGEEEGE